MKTNKPIMLLVVLFALAMTAAPLRAQEPDPVPAPEEEPAPAPEEQPAPEVEPVPDEQPAPEVEPVPEVEPEAEPVPEVEPEPEVEPAPAPAPVPTEEEREIEETIDEAAGEEWIDTGRQPEPEPEPEPEVVIIEEEPEDDNRPQRREVQTLMSPGSGGFGALSIGYTQVNSLDALQMGARAEWVIGHGFGLGITGTGFTSDFTTVDADYYAISGGYGGLVMEPIILGWLPVHISLPIVVGGGGLASYATNSDPWDYDNMDPSFGEYSVFFIVEAGAELEFNLTRFFRLSLFGNYRWTTPLDMKAMYGLTDPSPYVVSSDALHGWSAGVRFKFGSF